MPRYRDDLPQLTDRVFLADGGLYRHELHQALRAGA
jgi:hypothetical protein